MNSHKSTHITNRSKSPYNFNHPEGLSRHRKEKQPFQNSEKLLHTHAYSGTTSNQNGHTHVHLGVTSSPINKSKEHVHKISGNTTFNKKHFHVYEGVTGPSIELPNGYHTHYIDVHATSQNGHKHAIKGYTIPLKN